MKGKTIRTLLISVTMAATILTGCNSNDKTLTTENETATIEESTTDVENYAVDKTTEIETSTIEETTTEEETFSIEENSTVEETTTDIIIRDSMVFSGDADEADINQIMKAVAVEVTDMDDCDENGDGVIDKDEAAEMASILDDNMIQEMRDYYDSIFNDDFTNSVVDNYMNSNSNSSSTSNSTTESTPSTSTSTITPRKDETNEDEFIHPGTDYSDLSTTSHSY
jgi:cell division protein FtsL